MRCCLASCGGFSFRYVVIPNAFHKNCSYTFPEISLASFSLAQIQSSDFPPFCKANTQDLENIDYKKNSRVQINGRLSVFHTEDMGSIPFTRKKAYLVKLVYTTDLKSVPFQGIGSSPIVSKKSLTKKRNIYVNRKSHETF